MNTSCSLFPTLSRLLSRERGACRLPLVYETAVDFYIVWKNFESAKNRNASYGAAASGVQAARTI